MLSARKCIELKGITQSKEDSCALSYMWNLGLNKTTKIQSQVVVEIPQQKGKWTERDGTKEVMRV